MNEFRKMRRYKQELSQEECIEILKKEPRGILAMQGENGYPYAIPLNQFYDEGFLYFHGAKTGLKLDLLEKNPKVCFTIMDEGFRKENDWALNIKSVVVLGTIERVLEPEEMLASCRKLAEKHFPNDEHKEANINADLVKNGPNVAVLKMKIERMTGKLVNES
ncbi:pyridoxamine 5'-phosphate oxidase family protein [Guggenheimella bovis]